MKSAIFLFAITLFITSCTKSNEGSDVFNNSNLLKTWDLEYTVYNNNSSNQSIQKDDFNTTYTFSKDSLRVKSDKGEDVFGDRNGYYKRVPFYVSAKYWLSSDNKVLDADFNYNAVSIIEKRTYNILELTKNKLVILKLSNNNSSNMELHFNSK